MPDGDEQPARIIDPIEIMKDYIVTLSKDRQDALYRWMHETLNCRVYGG